MDPHVTQTPTLKVSNPSPRLVLQLSFVDRVLRKSGCPEGNALIATADELEKPVVIPLESSRIEIGRENGPPELKSIPGLSRRHFRLARDGEGYTVEDLGAKNRVWRNARRVEGSTPVRNGDILSAGQIQFVVYLPEPMEETPSIL